MCRNARHGFAGRSRHVFGNLVYTSIIYCAATGVNLYDGSGSIKIIIAPSGFQRQINHRFSRVLFSAECATIRVSPVLRVNHASLAVLVAHVVHIAHMAPRSGVGGLIMEEKLIAPCGMNCALCVNYLAFKNDLKKKGFTRSYCVGCRPRGKNCTFLKGRCDKLGEGQVNYCFECADYPCVRLKALDRRYRTKYRMSMIQNLEQIRTKGVEPFLAAQAEQWRCSRCGGNISCHIGLCLACDLEKWRQNRKYRWGER